MIIYVLKEWKDSGDTIAPVNARVMSSRENLLEVCKTIANDGGRLSDFEIEIWTDGECGPKSEMDVSMFLMDEGMDLFTIVNVKKDRQYGAKTLKNTIKKLKKENFLQEDVKIIHVNEGKEFSLNDFLEKTW